MNNKVQRAPQNKTGTQPARTIGLGALLTAFTAATVLIFASVGEVSPWRVLKAQDVASKPFVAKDVTADSQRSDVR